MDKRKLGDLEVSELGAGCMSISANYGPAAALFTQVALADDYVDFLTLPAYEQMP